MPTGLKPHTRKDTIIKKVINNNYLSIPRIIVDQVLIDDHVMIGLKIIKYTKS
jgi:hypothetical protein